MSFRGQKIFKPCRSGHPESWTPRRICLTQWRRELGIASLSFPFSFPPLPFLFSPLPLASIRSRTPKIQVEGLGSAVSSPSGPVGLERSPNLNRIWFQLFSWESTNRIGTFSAVWQTDICLRKRKLHLILDLGNYHNIIRQFGYLLAKLSTKSNPAHMPAVNAQTTWQCPTVCHPTQSSAGEFWSADWTMKPRK